MSLRQFKILFLAAVVLCAGIGNVEAKGLLGEKYVGVGIKATKFGADVYDNNSDLDDTMTSGELSLNLPVNPNLDFTSSVVYSKYDTEITLSGLTASADVKQLSANMGLTYHFSPEAKVNPFLSAGLAYVRTETKASVSGTVSTIIYPGGWGYGYRITSSVDASVDRTSDDFGFSLGGGCEIDLSEKVAITPSIAYRKVDNLDDTTASVVLNVWLTDSVSWQIISGYAFDEGDIIYGTSLIFNF